MSAAELANPVRVFGLIYSRYCIARCDHCGSSSGPHVRGVMPMDTVARCLDDIRAFDIDSVIITGGEPLAFHDEICCIGKMARDHGLSMQVCTNAFWAKTPEKAYQHLQDLVASGLVHLMLSTDRFHVKYVPVESVINAATAAGELGISCQVAVPSMARDWDSLSLVTRLRQETDACVYTHPVHPVGRAESFSWQQLRWNKPEVRGCELLGHIEVDFDGKVSACPTGADYGAENQLVLGKLEENSLHNIITRYQSTLIYYVIGSYGPLGLQYLLEAYGVRCSGKLPDIPHDCHLCRLLIDDKKIFLEFHERSNIDLTHAVASPELEMMRDQIDETIMTLCRGKQDAQALQV